ncbi:hypothetical protein BKA69DRAFT_941644 [Paraphysoderma sedebokerense]|nr:hypothetical protein BKA69DRAFT_941644 [Paraphysoderma sedebokerense]
MHPLSSLYLQLSFLCIAGLPCPPRQYVGVVATELSNVVIMTLVGLECYVVWKRKWHKTPLLIGGFLFALAVMLNALFIAISPVSRTKDGTCIVAYRMEVGTAFYVTTIVYYIYTYIVTAYKLTSHLTIGSRNQSGSRNVVSLSTARNVLALPTSHNRSASSATGQLGPSSKLYVLLTCNHRFALAIVFVAVFKVLITYFIPPSVAVAYGGPIARSISTIHCLIAYLFVSEVTKPQRRRSRSQSSSSPPSSQTDRSNMSQGTINTNHTSSTLNESQSRDHTIIKIDKPRKSSTSNVNGN